MGNFAAIDLGASSGRVAVGIFKDGKFELDLIHRFENYQISSRPGEVLWDWHVITTEVIKGLKLAHEKYSLDSVAVDAWAVDYVLFNKSGEITAPIYSYRDDRTDGRMEIVTNDFDAEEIYLHTGIQFQPFNTLYQLLTSKDADQIGENSFLLIPDAINNFLCGSNSTERTNASTTQMYDRTTGDWYWKLIDQLQLPRSLFPPLHNPLTHLGVISGHGKLDGIPVVAVGSHDTASAIAGTPLASDCNEIYISSGTWSLIGTESDQYFATEDALKSNLTNELGVNHTVRLLKNVSGMWIISECLREWAEQGIHLSIQELVEGASRYDTCSRIDPSDPLFLHPGKMVDRINYYLRTHGDSELTSPFEIARCVFESLAQSYKDVIDEISKVTGRGYVRIHVVGGGSANTLLNQLTADVTGLAVSTGPIEATLIGNVGVQAISKGEIRDLKELRHLISKNYRLEEYKPMKGNRHEPAH